MNLHSTIQIVIYIEASRIDLRKKRLFSIHRITCTKAILIWEALLTRILPHFGICRLLVCCTTKREERSIARLFLRSNQGVCLQTNLLLYHQDINFWTFLRSIKAIWLSHSRFFKGLFTFHFEFVMIHVILFEPPSVGAKMINLNMG